MCSNTATHAAIQSSVAVSSNMCAATHQQHSNTVCVQYHSMYPDKHTYNFGTASPVCNGQLSIEHYMHRPSLSIRLPVNADSKKTKKKPKTHVSCRSIHPAAMCLRPGTACTSWQCPSSITRWSSKPCCV